MKGRGPTGHKVESKVTEVGRRLNIDTNMLMPQELKEKAQELKAEGNALFKDNNLVGAVVAYTDALRTCPLACAKERSIMWSNRAACKLHMVSANHSKIYSLIFW